MPIPDPFAVKLLLETNLRNAVTTDEGYNYDDKRWNELYESGIAHFINTPRKITRLVNRIVVSYPKVSEEVDLRDFIAMETLSLCYQSVYNYIWQHGDSFFGDPNQPIPSDQEKLDAAWEIHEKCFGLFDDSDREFGQRLILSLFPRVSMYQKRTDGLGLSELRKSNIGPEDWKRFINERRVCTSAFEMYFNLYVPRGVLSAFQIKEIVRMSSSPDDFLRELARLSRIMGPDGRPQSIQFLVRLDDRIRRDMPLSNEADVVRCLLGAYDRLDINDTTFRDHCMKTIVGIVNHKKESEERYSLLASAFKGTTSSSTQAFLLDILATDDRKEIELETKNHLAATRGNILQALQLKDLLDKIRVNIESERQAGKPKEERLKDVLARLQEWQAVREQEEIKQLKEKRREEEQIQDMERKGTDSIVGRIQVSSKLSGKLSPK